MAGARKRGRNSRTPATTTTTSTSVSPLSTSNSVEPETPDTSEPELAPVKKPVVSTSILTRNARKRAAEDDVDIYVAPKRRVVGNAVVVKAKPIPTSKNKGRGKARVIDTPEPDDDAPISEDEPQHDETYVDSDRSGIDTARREAQHRSGAAGTSTSRSRVTANEAAMRTVDSDSDEELYEESAETDDESEISALESTDEELVSKRKGKAKATAKPKEWKAKSPPEPMSWSEKRRLARRERLETRKEQRFLAQKLGRQLTWAEKTSLALHKHHPELRDVWGDLEELPVITPEKAEQPAGLKVTLLPFQQESLWWMGKQERSIWRGGLLAVSICLTITIQMISLFVSDLKRPNLVIAPTVAIMQWRNEINAHTEGMNVLVWHGASRIVNPKELKRYDVVLTSYAVVESCFRKQESGFKRKGHIVKEASPLHRIKWNRIVLDEAHNIKERSTNTAKACFELKSNYKWCLSGTPLQNRVGELYSIIRFLGGDPFAYYFCKKCDCKSLHWKFSDKKNCDDVSLEQRNFDAYPKNGMEGPGKAAFRKLRSLLERMMLRRTKIQRADDLGLPPRTVIVRRDYFSPEEKELYLSLFSDAKRQFSTYADSGTVLNNYSNIFSLITRMRQMACHPDLVLRSKSNGNTFFSSDELSEATVCRLCNDIAEDAIQAKCRHIFDRECMNQYLSTAGDINPECPVCHLPLTIDLEGPALELESTSPTARQGIIGRLNLDVWRSSSKIEALVEELSNLRTQDATTKSIVFSQFVNFLDLIAFRLQKAGFQICRLEGTMSPQARDATIQYFTGGVALNLTEASRVYLMDSWWNPAVEYQAMDRIHRLGQHRPIQAIKLVIEDSIESRIVQLQEKKSAMVNATLSTDESAMGRLTPEDLGFLFRVRFSCTIPFSLAKLQRTASRVYLVRIFMYYVAPPFLATDTTQIQVLGMSSKEFTVDEVAQVDQPQFSPWIVIDAKVYDLTRFADLHPGGANVLWAPGVAGKDATDVFFGLHRHEVLLRPQYARLQIGTVRGETERIKPPAPGALSRVPYAEPTWLSAGFHSPYYNDGHRRFHNAVRAFFMTEVYPEAVRCEENGKRVSQGAPVCDDGRLTTVCLVDVGSAMNFLAMRLGPGKHLQGRVLMGGVVTPEEYDHFHELILNLELARFGTRGFVDGMLNGGVIALPPIFNFGSPDIQARYVPAILGGKKYIALAITEAFAGSDVAGVQTVAVRDGDDWVVTGTKKWITNGTFADYFTTLCRTDQGPLVLLIPRSDNVSTKPVKTSYSSTAGTAYVTFDGARVPASHMLGKVGQGLYVILSNFNHERWMVAATSLGAQRVVVEECLKWTNQRIAFKKPLHAQAVIRAKLALMIERVEACQAWIENITHQMNNMNYGEQSDKLAGPIALVKKFISRSGRETAEDATQMFGGRGITMGGMGKIVENFHRTSPFDAILAGAEDVLGDLGVRQAIRKIPKDARL
ncbi:hypothetical protein JVT61DRAFT_3799 [Boletus reticuloceps]|uniref:Uncharacterized protein n=1 Tax=Boletus reticuloceps TaxID=495285 RepID=A0A8I3A9Z6_9AGAM|nr:hypothetical protein JVT61DRAFT_3799 [Boletus reticuloceps]